MSGCTCSGFSFVCRSIPFTLSFSFSVLFFGFTPIPHSFCNSGSVAHSGLLIPKALPYETHDILWLSFT